MEKKIIPILEGYDDLGKLIELHSRVRDTFRKLGWYLGYIERRIAEIMKSSKDGAVQ